MTPKGLQAWCDQAEPGARIIYYQGEHLNESSASRAIGDAAYAIYETGIIHLFQTRLTPKADIDKNTKGTFAWWVQKR